MTLSCAVCVELFNNPVEWRAALTIIGGIAVCKDHMPYLPDYSSDEHPLNQTIQRCQEENRRRNRSGH